MLRRASGGAAMLLALSCASLTPHGSKVRVFQAPLSESGGGSPMPQGCGLLFAHPAVDMSERDMTTDKDPFLLERNRAGQGGANALLVRSRMIVPRQDFNCAAAQPITDCPLSEGAWYRVVFEDYACSPAALRALETGPPHGRPE